MLRSEPEKGLTTQESLIMGVTQLEVQPETFQPLQHCFQMILLHQNAATADNSIHPIHASQLLIHPNRSKFFEGQGDVLFA